MREEVGSCLFSAWAHGPASLQTGLAGSWSPFNTLLFPRFRVVPIRPEEERGSETVQLLLGKFSCFTVCLVPQRGLAALSLTDPPELQATCQASLPTERGLALPWPLSLSPPSLPGLAAELGKQADPGGANVIPL